MGIFSKLFKGKNKENSSDAKENIKSKDCAENEKNAEKTAEPAKNDIIPNKNTANTKEVKSDLKQNDETSSKNIVTEDEENIAASTAKQKKNTQVGFFEIKKAKDDRFVFNLYASNKVIIATSQLYTSSQSAYNGIKSVIANAAKANIEDQTIKSYESMPFPKWEIYLDKGNQYRFRLSASNGSCICHSQGYTSKANCKNGIDSIIRTVQDATIDKSYLK